MTTAFPRIAIVGAGAIGLYYGIRLGLAGAEVRFLLRGDLEAVRARGSLRLIRGSEITELANPAVFGSTAEIGPVDLVILALKTTSNGDVPSLLPPLLGPDTVILTLQNGLGSDETLATLFGAERVMGGLAFIGTHRVGPGEVAYAQPGSVMLGQFGRAPDARTQALAAQFAKAGVNIRVAENLDSARWHKLVWNVPFNGLSIAAGCVATDRLCADPPLATEVRALMGEIQAGAAKLGHTIADDFLKNQFDVTPPLGAYRPSSLVDFLAGRDVEVEPIWGEPLRRGQAAGASLPRLSLLYALLQSGVAQRKSPA
jgi:2-dehydropantoate 2-reductase